MQAQLSHSPDLRDPFGKVVAALDALMLEQTAMAAKVSGLAQHVEREQKKSETLSRASQVVNSSLDLDAVLRNVLDMAVEVMKAERGFLMLADESGKHLNLAAMHNLDRPALESKDLQISQSIVRKVFESGEAIITTDAQNDPRFNAQQSIMSLHIRSIVCVPLKAKDRAIGVAYLDSRVIPGLFSRQDPELLLSFANQAALAIENARLFRDQQAKLREIEQLEEFQARVLSSITSGVITLDSKRKITTFNEAAASTFGISAGSMTGKGIDALEHLVPGISMLVERFESHGIGGTEMAGIHPSGTSLVLEIRIAALDLGNGQHGLAIAIADMTQQRELERLHEVEVERAKHIEASFSRYLAPHVVQSLMKDPDSVGLGGERVPATILFADIRGFTAMSTKMQAEKVVELLNNYLDVAINIVFRHDGLLDKFYGDGLMAVFGPPRVRPDDAARAINTALSLIKAVDTINPQLSQPLSISVGIATGEVVSGHIGSKRRMDYTVIGDAVNLASRLEAASPPGNVFTDEPTYLASGLNLPAEKMSAKVRGRDDMVTIYSLKI
jgi:class 3 adenylate cyclase/GAF domain-containing protein